MTQIRGLIDDAFRKIGVAAHDEPLQPEYAQIGLRALSRMLKTWQNYGLHLWSVTPMAVTLTTAPSYVLPDRPLRIQNARLKRGSVETPMQPLTRDEYDRLPVKTSAGLPTSFYYDLQRDTGTLFVWPVLAVAGGETLQLTVERELDDADSLGGKVDSPDEYEEAVVYNLAARLAPDFGKSIPGLNEAAGGLLQLALSADREGSVFFYEERN